MSDPTERETGTDDASGGDGNEGGETDGAADRAADRAADDPVRCWLVERTYTDRGLVDMVYATPDGSHVRRKQVATTVMRQRGTGTTAAVDVDRDDLEPVDDEATRERYAAEAERMRAEYEPDEEV
ncbi:MAG: hypothetical protein ABEK02_07440 [Haloquadratum sp.]